MVIAIDGVEYFSAADVEREVGVVRQTLWRWRRDRVVPQGRRYRGRAILFTRAEVEAISGYANRLEPAEPPPPLHRGSAPAPTSKGDK
jgi:predicted DNA-binding transcriptional regulator AlpA